MPGAPWRSQGCNTCRRRKVKCDGERPHCARCLRGGHRCDGYDRCRKFVHTFAEPVASKAKNLPASRSPSESAVPCAAINVNAQIRSQLFSLFIDSYIPSRPVGKVNFRCTRASNIIEVFPSIMNGKDSQLLDRAISALATVFVGKTADDDRLIRHGMMLYNHAIQVFARMIPRAGLPVQEVLCANVVFQLYELINCTAGFSGWMAHMEGANAVLARHEKSLERDELSTMLLRHLKLSNIFHAIGKSKSALAFCPMWRVLMSSVDSSDPMDEIIDILMGCTSLVEQMDAVQSEQNAQNVMVSCLTLRAETKAWYGRFELIHGTPLFTTTPDTTNILQDGFPNPVFPERFEFATVEVAEGHMLYWAALLIIYSLLHGIELQKDFFRPGASNKGQAAMFQEGAEFYANQICRSVAYFLQPHMHILGGHNLLFPVSMASQFFYRSGMHDQYRNQYQWCQEVFASLESSGLGLANVLQGTPWSRYKEGEAAEPVVEVVE